MTQAETPTRKSLKTLAFVARPEGFEPPTHCFEGSCSIP
jgi:hypothetical protein